MLKNSNVEVIENNDQELKINEKMSLKNIASGIGLAMIIELFLSLVFSAILEIMAFGIDLNNINMHSNECKIPISLYYTISSVFFIFSVFTPFYFIARSFKISFSELLPFKKVKSNILWPLVGAGMGICICANDIADLFDASLNLFGIKPEIPQMNIDTNFLSIIMLIVQTAIAPALMEEFAFRGICLGAFRKFGDGFAIIMSSILFALLHCNLVQIPFALVVGLTLGYITVKTNSIIPSMIIHFLNNLYAISIDIIATQSSHLSEIFRYTASVLFLIAGIISYIYISMKDKDILSITPSESALSLNEKFKYSVTNIAMACALIILFLLTLVSI